MSNENGRDEAGEVPFDRASERTVIGAFLRNAPENDGALEDVTLAAFYGPEHRRIMEVVFALRDDGRRVDVAAVLDRLADDGMLTAVGGAAALGAIVEDRADLARAVQILTGFRKLRNLLNATEDINDAILRNRPRDHPDRW